MKWTIFFYIFVLFFFIWNIDDSINNNKVLIFSLTQHYVLQSAEKANIFSNIFITNVKIHASYLKSSYYWLFSFYILMKIKNKFL